MITHLVVFKFNDPNPAKVEEARAALAGMVGKVPQLRYLEVGADVLHSERSYDLGLIARFDSWEDLKAYQAHPAHLEVAKLMQPMRKSIITVDFES